MDWIHLTRDRNLGRGGGVLIKANELSGSMKRRKFLEYLSDSYLLEKRHYSMRLVRYLQVINESVSR